MKEDNSPKSLTSKQRKYVEELAVRCGVATRVPSTDGSVGFIHAEHDNEIKRAVLKSHTVDILGVLAAPKWITRNPQARVSGKRGMYTLGALLALPIVDPEKKSKTTKEEGEAV